MKPKTTPFRIKIRPGTRIRLRDTKRGIKYNMYEINMFFDTREECRWWDLVLPKGTPLYKALLKRKSFPVTVFMAKSQGLTAPIRIAKAPRHAIRRSHLVSHGHWPTSFVVSVTWGRITPLDYIDLLDKNI